MTYKPEWVLPKIVEAISDPVRDKITVSWEGLPPSPNEKTKHHWSKNAKVAKEWRQIGTTLGLASKARVRGAIALLHYHVSLGDERRHDYDNILAGFKPFQDGLVDAKIIEDDSFEYVVPIVTFDRTKPRRFTLDIYSLD